MDPMEIARNFARLEEQIRSLEAQLSDCRRQIEALRADHDISTGHLSPRAVRRLAERDTSPAS